MTRNYDVAEMVLAEYLKKAGDVHIGLVETGHVLQVEDFENAELFTYEEGFCCGSFELNTAIEQVECYKSHPEKYQEEYDKCEPTDSMYEIYEIMNKYIVAYEDINEEYGVDIVWMKKKEGIR